MKKQQINVLKEQFILSKHITHLNHGSFGACPKPIFDNYQFWQLKLEQEPVNFYVNEGMQHLEKSRDALATYINCDAQNIVFTTNPSYAINIIAKGFNLKEGDEILSSNLEYGALIKTWDYYCKKAKAKFIKSEITLPISSKEQIIDEFFKNVSSKTRAIFISQITSSTALILPVKEICERAKELDLITIVDGAHVPGHIDLDLSKLKVDIYTGACHKWMLTPKGCSFLYINEEFKNRFDPLIISWGYNVNSNFSDHHELQGTRDYSAFLTIPTAVQFLKNNDWKSVSNTCKQMVLSNYEKTASILNGKPICPVSADYLGQICSSPIKTVEPERLKSILYNEFKIEVPIMELNDSVYLRFSTQAYIDQNDIDLLHQALETIKQQTNLIES
jgi:isopenicillin-N epimerase